MSRPARYARRARQSWGRRHGPTPAARGRTGSTAAWSLAHHRHGGLAQPSPGTAQASPREPQAARHQHRMADCPCRRPYSWIVPGVLSAQFRLTLSVRCAPPRHEACESRQRHVAFNMSLRVGELPPIAADDLGSSKPRAVRVRSPAAMGWMRLMARWDTNRSGVGSGVRIVLVHAQYVIAEATITQAVSASRA